MTLSHKDQRKMKSSIQLDQTARIGILFHLKLDSHWSLLTTDAWRKAPVNPRLRNVQSGLSGRTLLIASPIVDYSGVIHFLGSNSFPWDEIFDKSSF